MRKWAVGLAVLVSLTAVTLVGRAAGAADGSAAPVSTLRVGVPSAIDNPNLWAVNSTSEWEAITMEYDMLLSFSPKDLTAGAGLATACKNSADYRTWTCTIRNDARWSDGQPVTSKDVAFTFQLVMDQKFPYFRSYIPEGSTFRTPDDRTFVWRTPRPSNAPMVPPWIYIVPEHVWSKYADLSQRDIKAVDVLPVVGSGPYVMTKAVAGQTWTFERNAQYWGPRPAYDQIVFQKFDNQEAMVQALKSGEIDIADNVNAPLLPSLQGQSDITVQKVVPDCWINMAFNFGGQGPDSDPLPALQDLTVRKAIAMAIDKQSLVDKVYPGAAEPGQTIIRPLSRFWHLNLPADQVLPFNPDEANRLLDEAGYTRGSDGIRVDPSTGKPLDLRLPTSGDTQGSEAAGRLIAGYLQQIGIRVDVQPVTAGKMYDIQQTGNFDAYIWYWCGDPDPDYQLSVFTSSQCGDLSDGCWKNAKYDRLYNKQRTTFDQNQRKRIVDEMQRIVYNQIPGIVLAYPNTIQAYRNDRVTDLTPIPQPDGYIVPNYNYTPFLDAKPVAAQTGSSDSGSSAMPVVAGVVGAAVVLGAIVLLLSRRRNADDSEEG